MLQQRLQRAILSEVRRRCNGTNIICSRRPFVSVTRPMWEKHSVAVPTMGDSITEGTVVEWVVAVGQAVKEEDVVALVETDKVTVDIRAKMNGVVTQQFVAVDETVEVGAPLYEIDTEAAATVTAAAETKATTPPAAVVPAEPVEIVASSSVAESSSTATAGTEITQQHHHHRVPMIKFLGKEGWERVLSGKEATEAPPAAAVAAAAPTTTSTAATTTTTSSSSSSSSPLAITVVDSFMINATYGRLSFTAEDMETLILGGANRAPKILSHNSVTKFKQVVA